MIRYLFVAFAITVALGCDSSPYGPGDNAYGPDKPPQQKPDPIVKVIPPPIYTLTAPGEVVLVEGTPGGFPVSATIQNDTPVLSIENLPKGATFDPTSRTFSWTPAAGDGLDPSDPHADGRIYPIYVDLRGASDANTVRQKTVMVIVRAKLQSLTFSSFPSGVDVNEGAPGTMTVQIADDAYPTGPFKVSLAGAPAGMTISPTSGDPTKYTFGYTPGFTVAKSNSPPCTSNRVDTCATVSFTVIVQDPAGQLVSSSGSWLVHNETQAPRVEAPASVRGNGGSTVTFSIYVEDINGENTPSVSADSNSGVVNVSTVSTGTNSAGNPDGIFQLTVNKSGTARAATVTIQSCVTDKRFNQQCANSTVNVSF